MSVLIIDLKQNSFYLVLERKETANEPSVYVGGIKKIEAPDDEVTQIAITFEGVRFFVFGYSSYCFIKKITVPMEK